MYGGQPFKVTRPQPPDRGRPATLNVHFLIRYGAEEIAAQ